MKTTTTQTNSIGPRAKCSQVVYEAIAKACEIIVRSRCCDKNTKKKNDISKDMSVAIPKIVNATSTRFNIEIEEMGEVRNILQRWRRSLHVPIQLDIILDSSDCDGNSSNNGILLERWCIDYEESSLKEEYGSSSISASTTTTIPQLRQVCKRVVILLRTLHCMTKLLPAYHLVVDDEHNSGSKGYYNNFTRSNIKYSIQAGNQLISESQDLKYGCSATCSYDRYQFIPIPTPYGNLRISVLYMPKVLQPPPPVSIETHAPSVLTADNTKATAENQINKIHAPNNRSINTSPNVSAAPKSRVLSGLSLALLNNEGQSNEPYPRTAQCYSDSEDEQQHVFETKSKSPPAFLRMHSLDERSSQYFDKAMSGSSHNNSNNSQQQSHGRGRKVERSPTPSEHSKKMLLDAASASPRPYMSHHHSSSNEYGYAYNNIKTRPIRIINRTPSLTSQHPLSATPPFSRSPALSAMPTPCLSSTPPFVSNPTSLQSTSSTRRSFTNPNIAPDSNFPPPPLTVLQASPFQSDPSSSMLADNKSSILTNPTPASASNNTTSFLQSHSNLLDSHHNHNDTLHDHDIMPFANTTDLTHNNSIYNEKSMESSASTFAHKCATTAATTKLQFNQQQYESNSNSNSLQHLNAHDLINQLQDFHTFGASLNGSCNSTTTK